MKRSKMSASNSEALSTTIVPPAAHGHGGSKSNQMGGSQQKGGSLSSTSKCCKPIDSEERPASISNSPLRTLSPAPTSPSASRIGANKLCTVVISTADKNLAQILLENKIQLTD